MGFKNTRLRQSFETVLKQLLMNIVPNDDLLVRKILVTFKVP